MGKFSVLILLFCSVAGASSYDEALLKTNEALLRQSRLDEYIPAYIDGQVSKYTSKEFKFMLNIIVNVADATVKQKVAVSRTWNF